MEGRLALSAVVASPYRLASVLVLRRRVAALEGLSLPGDVPVYVVDDEVMAATTGFDVHRGVLALAARPAPVNGLELVAARRPRLLVVAEGVSDQENLGSLFRNAAAFGAGLVLLGPTCCDPLYRRTVRVSLGHVLTLPFGRLMPWPSALGGLGQLGYTLLALTPRPSASPLAEVAGEVGGAAVAVVVGAEGDGLADEVIALCRPVRIPMATGVDSINLAAATAVALSRLVEAS